MVHHSEDGGPLGVRDPVEDLVDLVRMLDLDGDRMGALEGINLNLFPLRKLTSFIINAGWGYSTAVKVPVYQSGGHGFKSRLFFLLLIFSPFQLSFIIMYSALNQGPLRRSITRNCMKS